MTRSFSEIINSPQPTLVDFYAEWCGPCKMMKPILQELKHAVGETTHILKIDVDRNPEAAALYEIRGVPTLAIFKNGKIVWRQSGVMPANELKRMIEKFS